MCGSLRRDYKDGIGEFVFVFYKEYINFDV